MGVEVQDVSKEQKIILTWMPHMIALVFMLKHLKAGTHKSSAIANDPGMIACTDGSTVWYGKTYDEIEPSGRVYVFIHELMHGILRHGTRFALIRLQKGVLFSVLANYAADAIINEGIDQEPISKTNYCRMPEKFPGIRMSTIHKIIKEAIDFSGEEPPADYDPKATIGLQMEQVYDWLVWAYDAVRRKRRENAEKNKNSNGAGAKSKGKGKGQGQKQPGGSPGSGSGEGGEETDQEPGESNKSGEGEQQDSDGDPADNVPPAEQTQIERIVNSEKAWDVIDEVREVLEELAKGTSINDLIARANGQIDEARGKIASIVQGLKMQGIGQGNMLLALESDLPPPVVPWDHILRRTVTRSLGTRLTDSYNKLGVSTKAALAMGRKPMFQPGTTIFTERPRILTVLDVSGSHLGELKQCFSEVWSIARMKNAAVDLITFDDGVQQMMEVKDIRDFQKILDEGITGGGGTSLSNVFKEIKKMRTPYRSCVIMTDGYLSPPDNTEGISLIWMITAGGTSSGLEGTGTIINLPDYMSRAA